MDEMQSSEKVEQAAEEFANAVAKVGAVERKSQFETIEQYAERAKSQVFADVEEFKGRLKRGFALIVEQLDEKNEPEE